MHPSAQKFADLIRDNDSEKAEVEAAVRELLQSATRNQESANEVLRSLVELISMPNRVRAGFVSVVCGSLVEQGCDPQPMAGPMTDVLNHVLPSCVELLDATMAEMPEIDPDDEETDGHELFDDKREQLIDRMPRQSRDWEALNAFWRAAVVTYSMLPAARADAVHLRKAAEQIYDHHEAGHWLSKLLAVMDNEPMIAIDPEKRLGIVGRISGIAENFQLNGLLMDVFPNPGFLKRRRISKVAAAMMRGEGPQTSNETLVAPWNLYTHEAISNGKSLSDEADSGSCNSQHWIWNEGIPDDIPVACGRRVIVIGKPSYSRAFQAQRMFAKLNASIDIDETLSPEQVDQWVTRISAGSK